MKKKLVSVIAALAVLAAAEGDVVTTTDGSRLVGTIKEVYKDELVLETSYAGTITLSQDQVESFETDEPVVVRLETGDTVEGRVQSTPGGELEVQGTAGSLTAAPADVAATWRTGGRDPLAAEMARVWNIEVGASLDGKDGNTEEFNAGLIADAVLDGPDDELRFYASYDRAEKNGTKTADEIIGGAEYTNYFFDGWGWYVREEIELDEFENLDFRSTSAVGLRRKFIERDAMKLSGRVGLSYIYEDYVDGGSDSYPGIDLGLRYFWQFAEWGEWDTEVTYTPAFEDFGNYRATHESTVGMPLGLSDFWKLQVGLRNEYRSEVAPDVEELDTTWFIRLILNWEQEQ